MVPGDSAPIEVDDELLRAVAGDETILRRFDPHNPQNLAVLTVDEGDTPRYRLNTAAFSGFSKDGCSVSRETILVAAGLTRDDVLVPPKYICVAEATVQIVREIRVPDVNGAEYAPFDVIPDSYPSRSEPEDVDVAHALITLNVTQKSDRKIAVGTLVRTAFNPILDGGVLAI